MERANQIDAIDMIAGRIGRLRNEIWLSHGDDLRLMKGMSGGEKRLHDVCHSIWNGETKVNLLDLVAELGDEDFRNVVQGLIVARYGITAIKSKS